MRVLLRAALGDVKLVSDVFQTIKKLLCVYIEFDIEPKIFVCCLCKNTLRFLNIVLKSYSYQKFVVCYYRKIGNCLNRLIS